MNNTGLIIKNGKVKRYTATSFDGLKEYLGFETADVFYFSLEGENFVAICDDEGLLKQNHVSIVKKNKDGNDQYIAGNVFILRNDIHWDNYSDLLESDYELFDKHIAMTVQFAQIHLVLLLED